MRIVHTVALLLTACAAPSEVSPPSMAGWTPETFVLPPPFAPGLPPGEESLLFAPGFQDPRSEEYWSYAFVVWMDKPIQDVAGLEDWLEAYYDGLVSMTARAEGNDVGDDPAQVQVERLSSGSFEASIRLTDADESPEPLHLRLLVACEAAERAVIRIQVSPQPREHEIWRSLEAAVMSIQEP